jgi:hypothetical protein
VKNRNLQDGLDTTILLRGAGKGFKKEKYGKVELNKFL